MSDLDGSYQMFLRKYGRKFPYNAIKKTRRTFHTKWLLLLGPSSTYTAIPSVCFDKETQMMLIMTFQALPATKEMDEIIEYMECWGRVEDPVWHRQVMNWLGFICQEGVKRDHLGLAYDCVAYKVRRIINLRVGTIPTSWNLTRRVISGWSDVFMAEWKRTHDFKTLKQRSVEYVLGEIPNPTPVSPNTVSSLDE